MCKSRRFKLFIFDHECRRAFDQAFATDPYYLPSELILPSSIQGFSICSEHDKNPIACIFCFPYIRKKGRRTKKVLRVTRPLLIPGSEGLGKDGFETLIREVKEIERRAGVHVIKVELYNEIRSRIFSPSTDCAINNYNLPECIQFFENSGFILSKNKFCFELDLEKISGLDYEGVSIRKWNPADDQEKRVVLWTLGCGWTVSI